MSATTARELRGYVDWASGLAMMPDDEVLVRTVDHALTEYFRNDKAWQKDRGEFLGSASSPPKTTGAKTDPAVAPPPSGKQDPKAGAAPQAAVGKAS